MTFRAPPCSWFFIFQLLWFFILQRWRLSKWCSSTLKTGFVFWHHNLQFCYTLAGWVSRTEMSHAYCTWHAVCTHIRVEWCVHFQSAQKLYALNVHLQTQSLHHLIHVYNFHRVLSIVRLVRDGNYVNRVSGLWQMFITETSVYVWWDIFEKFLHVQ